MVCGVAQTEPRLGERDRNLVGCLARLEEAAAAGCELLVLPECATTGYMFETAEEAARHAEEIPGPSIEALEEACARLDVYCVAGILERDGDVLRNTAGLVGPEGLVGRYWKSHLPCLGVDRFVEPGRPVLLPCRGRVDLRHHQRLLGIAGLHETRAQRVDDLAPPEELHTAFRSNTVGRQKEDAVLGRSGTRQKIRERPHWLGPVRELVAEVENVHSN